MEAKKVLVKKSDETIICCPLCQQVKNVSVGQYRKNRQRDLRVKCSCGHLFCLCLEYRQQPRKHVKLLGKFTNITRHRNSQAIIVGNISAGGIGFRPFGRHGVKKDDLLQVEFTLNDFKKTDIEAIAKVSVTTSDYVGCKFNATENFKISLGFYLLN